MMFSRVGLVAPRTAADGRLGLPKRITEAGWMALSPSGLRARRAAPPGRCRPFCRLRWVEEASDCGEGNERDDGFRPARHRPIDPAVDVWPSLRRHFAAD
jgi:hypothetical protein